MKFTRSRDPKDRFTTQVKGLPMRPRPDEDGWTVTTIGQGPPSLPKKGKVVVTVVDSSQEESEEWTVAIPLRGLK